MRLFRALYQTNFAGVNSQKLYDTHIPTSGLQKVALAASSAVAALLNPGRADSIATLGDSTGHETLYNIRLKMLAHPVGQRIISERPTINSVNMNLDELLLLPDNSVGKTYANFMTSFGLSSDTRTPPRFVDHEELAYVIKRYRQVHDFVHTIVGATDVSVLTEIGVKWFEMMQTGLPMTALASVFGPLALTSTERGLLRKHYIPWAVHAGVRADFFMNIYFEDHLETDLDEFRRTYNIVPMPRIPVDAVAMPT